MTDPKAGTIEVLNYTGHRVRFAPDDGKTVGAADGPKDGVGRPGRPAPAVPGDRGPGVARVPKK